MRLEFVLWLNTNAVLPVQSISFDGVKRLKDYSKNIDQISQEPDHSLLIRKKAKRNKQGKNWIKIESPIYYIKI